MTRKRDSILTVVAMSLGFGVVQLDVSVVNVAIRPIGDALGGGVAALQWIVSAYTIMSAHSSCRPGLSATGLERGGCSSPGSRCSQRPPRSVAWRRRWGS